MKSTIKHKHTRRKLHYKSELHRNHTNHQADPAHNISPWVKRLTTSSIDPKSLQHHLNGAGETLRGQTFQRQHQHKPEGSPLTVGPADDDMEKQAAENANNISVSAYAVPFEKHRLQGIERTMVNHFNQGINSGIGISRMLGI